MIAFHSPEHSSVRAQRPGLILSPPENSPIDDRPEVEVVAARIGNVARGRRSFGRRSAGFGATASAQALVRGLECDEPPFGDPTFLGDLRRLREILNGLDLSPLR